MGPGNLVTRDIMSLQHTQQVGGTQLHTFIYICLYFNSVLGCQCVLITMCCMPMFELYVSRYVTWCHNMTRDTCLMSYSANVPMMPQTHITPSHTIIPMFREDTKYPESPARLGDQREGNNHREMWSLTLSIALFRFLINLNDRNIYKMVGIYDWFVQLTGAVKIIKITSPCPQPVSGDWRMSGQKTV